MTTTVKVEANHGWPVDVTRKNIGANGPDGAYPMADHTVRVPAGETQVFSVHSTCDLLIHEVQPGEVAAAAQSDDDGA